MGTMRRRVSLQVLVNRGDSRKWYGHATGFARTIRYRRYANKTIVGDESYSDGENDQCHTAVSRR